MTKTSVRSGLVALLLVAGSAMVSAGQAASGPSTSPELADQFTAAQKALDAKRYAEVAAKAKEILASPKKTPDDVYAANYFQMMAAQQQRNTPGLIAALEGMLGSGFATTPAAMNTLRRPLMSANFGLKNYAEAIKYATELAENGAADDEVRTVLAQSYYMTKNYGEAIKLFSGLVSAAEKAGRKPDRNDLVALRSSYERSGNAEAAQATLEKLVKYHPDQGTWLALLYDVKREKLDFRQQLHVYRLMESTGNLKDGRDIMAYSDAALGLGLAAESHEALDLGLKSKAWPGPEDQARAQRYFESAAKRREETRAELAKLEAEAKAAATGNEYVALGMMYYSFRNFPKAVEALQAGIQKGGLKNEADARLSLGVAQLKAGQKGEAGQTLRGIKADNDVTQRIVELWELYAN